MNILVTEDYSCKLTDFGCAKLLTFDRQIFNTVNSGTPLWMAPEVKRGQYSFPADIYSLGLVLFELFEKKLPFFDQVRQIVVLPNSFQSASVVMPCLNQVPEKRPLASRVVGVLDKMIRNIVESVRNLLPEMEQVKLRAEALGGADSSVTDGLDAELKQLYRHLLSKPPAEVDALINRAFQINENPRSNAAPPYVPGPVQQPVIPSNPGYRGPPPPGYHVPSAYTPPVFVGTPSYNGSMYYNQPAYNAAPPPYPAGGTHAPPPYKASSDMELDMYLDNLTVSELHQILQRNNVEASFFGSKTDLISKIKTLPPQVLDQFRPQRAPQYHAPSRNLAQTAPTSMPPERAKNLFNLYADGQDHISKPVMMMILESDEFLSKMERSALRDTAEVLFDNNDHHSGKVTQQVFIQIYENLVGMC